MLDLCNTVPVSKISGLWQLILLSIITQVTANYNDPGADFSNITFLRLL